MSFKEGRKDQRKKKEQKQQEPTLITQPLESQRSKVSGKNEQANDEHN